MLRAIGGFCFQQGGKPGSVILMQVAKRRPGNVVLINFGAASIPKTSLVSNQPVSEMQRIRNRFRAPMSKGD